ncbi:MAG: response regulator transcription factor [bacterium]|nr:response regulator transcription factor [bacterium]
MFKTLIADECPIFRAGLEEFLRQTDETTSIDVAGTSEELLRKVKEKTYDVLVMDSAIHGEHTVDILRQLRAISPRTRILAMGDRREGREAIRTLRFGASGYLARESTQSEFKEAIGTVLKGKKYISPEVAVDLASLLEANSGKPLENTLSDREYQIMCMLASGRTVKEVAAELSLSVKTISTHRHRILSKMKLKNTAQLIYYAVKHHLVD